VRGTIIVCCWVWAPAAAAEGVSTPVIGFGSIRRSLVWCRFEDPLPPACEQPAVDARGITVSGVSSDVAALPVDDDVIDAATEAEAAIEELGPPTPKSMTEILVPGSPG